MKKSEFIAKVKSMKRPIIETSGFHPFRTPIFWIIRDAHNHSNKFCTSSIRMTITESKFQDRYLDREDKTEKKYKRWIEEATK